jgi:tetratricopeptide (TPR) repeat protein
MSPGVLLFERWCVVARLRSLRRVSLGVLSVLLLPMTLSCSGGKPSEQAKGGETDRAAPADSEAARLDKVIADCTEAIRLRPKEVNQRGELPHYRRGRAFADKGEHDKAIADYDEAIRLYPVVKGPYADAHLVEARGARAESYRKKGDYDKAIADYTKIIETVPPGGKTYDEALRNSGVLANAHYRRGVCYDDKGQHDKAMAEYNAAVKIAPDLKKNEDLKRRMSK